MAVAEEYIRHLDEQIGVSEGFVINDDAKADWALRKIGQAERNKAERAEFVAAEIARLQAWQAELDGRDESTVDRMTQLLEPYYVAERERGRLGKSKTLKLPHGSLTARKRGVQYERDDDILLPWAQERDLAKVSVRVDWAALKKRLVTLPGGTVADKETGEPVPGVVVGEPEGEAFAVKADAGEGREA